VARLRSTRKQRCFIVYAGKENQARKHGTVVAWDNIDMIMQQSEK
jgi:hypothetical protein